MIPAMVEMDFWGRDEACARCPIEMRSQTNRGRREEAWKELQTANTGTLIGDIFSGAKEDICAITEASSPIDNGVYCIGIDIDIGVYQCDPRGSGRPPRIEGGCKGGRDKKAEHDETPALRDAECVPGVPYGSTYVIITSELRDARTIKPTLAVCRVKDSPMVVTAVLLAPCILQA